MAMLLLRSMENWRRPVTDYDSIVILLAIAAISGEKLTRTTLEREFQDLAKPIPRDRLTPCNISSIAEATGLNRETTRRKVNRLLAAGLIERNADGTINFAPGFSQRAEPMALVRSQLDILNRVANELVRDGVLKWRSSGTGRE
jgi:DNA-binding transcriptional ArsR family regulator